MKYDYFKVAYPSGIVLDATIDLRNQSAVISIRISYIFIQEK